MGLQGPLGLIRADSAYSDPTRPKFPGAAAHTWSIFTAVAPASVGRLDRSR